MLLKVSQSNLKLLLEGIILNQTIEKEGLMSKYKEIASMIEEKIVNGYYDETNKLLTEDVLIKEYQSSSNTIQGSGVLLRKGDSEGAINLENFTGKPNS